METFSSSSKVVSAKKNLQSLAKQFGVEASPSCRCHIASPWRNHLTLNINLTKLKDFLSMLFFLVKLPLLLTKLIIYYWGLKSKLIWRLRIFIDKESYWEMKRNFHLETKQILVLTFRKRRMLILTVTTRSLTFFSRNLRLIKFTVANFLGNTNSGWRIKYDPKQILFFWFLEWFFASTAYCSASVFPHFNTTFLWIHSSQKDTLM